LPPFILIPPEVSQVLENQIQHSDEAEKEPGKKKPGAGLKFFIEFEAEVAKQSNDAAEFDSEARPFHDGPPFFVIFILLVGVWKHLVRTLNRGFEQLFKQVDFFSFVLLLFRSICGGGQFFLDTFNHTLDFFLFDIDGGNGVVGDEGNKVFANEGKAPVYNQKGLNGPVCFFREIFDLHHTEAKLAEHRHMVAKDANHSVVRGKDNGGGPAIDDLAGRGNHNALESVSHNLRRLLFFLRGKGGGLSLGVFD
jgi:hypothetical protein